uniref:Uncharacterized protein n=1 Tax=Seriola lalandi dorsalis TaxID=1841481 RepID=A0A3B4WXS7_SERLL
CWLNVSTDERIGESLFSSRVIEEELKDVPSEDVPPLTPLAVEVQTEQEQKVVSQLSKMVRIIGDRVQAHLPQSVREILMWTVDFFKNNLLSWIREHGGWINSFSELAMASMQSISFMSSQRVSLVIIFIAGLALGSFITWKLTR